MHDISIILLISYSLTVSLLLGAITHKIGLSPIVGYLCAGILLGPFTPGFVGDTQVASQLAEIGVILLMFGVGLHFKTKDLLKVKNVAVPAAILLSIVIVLLTTMAARFLGYPYVYGSFFGVAISVASTVVLIRLLTDHGLLHSSDGHISVGWLIVEDILTIIVLVLLPSIKMVYDSGAIDGLYGAFFIAIGKIALLIALVFILGKKLLPLLMDYMARTRSRELFTLSVLAVAMGVATGSAVVFGVSMALGAFLAGLVVGQSDVSHQAATDALPMKDAFAVLFFVSIGMLFNPFETKEHFALIVLLIFLVLCVRPLISVVFLLFCKVPLSSSIRIGFSRVQIAEFSFILAEAARHIGLLPPYATSVLVSCAIVTITLTPIIFNMTPHIEKIFLRFFPSLSVRIPGIASEDSKIISQSNSAIVVGFGPVGQTLSRILLESGIEPVVIDMNIDTIKNLRAEGRRAIYGDATNKEILLASGVTSAKFFVVTLPTSTRYEVVAVGKQLNPSMKIIMRAHYVSDKGKFFGASDATVVYEELETAVALAEVLLKEMHVDTDITHKVEAIRRELTASV